MTLLMCIVRRSALLLFLPLLVSPLCGQEETPLLLRAESLAVLPKSQPMLYVQVANTSNQPVTATISIRPPASWRVARTSQEVTIEAGATQRLGFSVAEGDETKTNKYLIEMTARVNDREWVTRQEIVVASAPYFKPTIDGDPSDWTDAIPVKSQTASRNTTVATFWNRRRFSVLISVEESQLVAQGKASAFDAVQLALAPRDTQTSRNPEDLASRFEYLVFANLEGDGVCCRLVQPEMPLSSATSRRPLDSLVDDGVEVAVRRMGAVTHYEVSLPLTEIREHIRPGEGREFFFGVLVHDPDGTGLRDWGVAAGMWAGQRNRLAWSDWEGAQWGELPPMDCRTEWGMCSSRY